MWYLAFLTVAIAAMFVWFFFKKASPDGSLDVNKDNRLDVNDIKIIADANKDGKVDIADVKAVVVDVVYEAPKPVVEAPKKKPARKKTAKKVSK